MSDAKAAGPSARWPDPSTAREVRQRMSGAPGGSQSVVEGGVVGDVVGGDKHEVHHHHDPRPHVDAAALGIGRSTTELVGRDEEIEAIVLALRGAGGEARGDAAGVPIHGVRGMGGLGKTALAREAAWRLRDRWPIQYLIDLRGAPGTSGGFGTPGPLTWQSAMRQIVQHLRPTERLPDADADGQDSALRAIYAGELSRRPMLLVLDNALDAAQVAPLLPPRGLRSAAIVTSRQVFTLPGGIVMRELGLLDPRAAARLARVHAARLTEEQATRLAVDLCGRLPLAIEIVARAVAIEELESVESMLDGLAKAKVATIEKLRGRSGATDVASLDAAIAWAFDRLPDDETRERFIDLAIFPASFDEAAALAVWGLEERAEEGRETLRSLRNVHLAQVEERPVTQVGASEPRATRWSLHDLVREWASGRREGSERADSRRVACATRFVDHFSATLDEASRRFLAGDQVCALAAFDLERPNIDAGFAMLGDRPIVLPERARRVVRYVGSGVSLLSLRMHPRRRVAWLKAQRDAAREVGDRRGEGGAMGNLGHGYLSLGDPRRAIELFEQCLAILREVGDRPGEGGALGGLGDAYAALGDARRAIEHYEHCLSIFREVGDRRGEGDALGSLGNAHASLGDARRAIQHYEQCVDVYQEVGDRCSEGTARGNIGLAYLVLGDAQRAIGHHEQALAIAREFRDRNGEGRALGHLGVALAALNEPRRAIERFEQSLAIFREVGDRRWVGMALGSLGEAYSTIGDPRRAIEHLEQCLAVAREVGDRRGEGVARGSLGAAYAALGDPRRAIEHYEQGLAISREVGDRNGETITSWNLGLFLIRQGDVERGIAFARTFLDYARAVGHPGLPRYEVQIAAALEGGWPA